VLLGLLVAYVIGTGNSTDPLTHCPPGDPAAVSMVLVDASDPLDGVQAERAKATIISEMKAMPARGRIDIYLADTADGSLKAPTYSLCNPGAPDQFTGIINDASAVRKAFEDDYLKAVDDTMSNLLQAKELPSSPIIESLRSAATKSFARLDSKVPLHITVISDMVQNSSLLKQKALPESQGDLRDEFDQFAKSASWPRALVDLHRADIEIVYVSRPKYRAFQGIGHLAWWEKYFDAMNGGRMTVDTI